MKRTILLSLFILVFSFNIFGQDKSVEEISIPKTIKYTNNGDIIETEEFQAYIKERNLLARIPNADKYGFLCCGFVGRKSQVKISINLENATVREILNEIVRQKGFGWTYREFSVIDEGKLHNIFRLDI